MTERLNPKKRKAEIFEAALDVARFEGFENMTRESIADRAGTSPTLVGHYYGTMNRLRTRIMRAAVQREIIEIVAHGLYTKNPHALKAPDDLKVRARKHLGAIGE